MCASVCVAPALNGLFTYMYVHTSSTCTCTWSVYPNCVYMYMHEHAWMWLDHHGQTLDYMISRLQPNTCRCTCTYTYMYIYVHVATNKGFQWSCVRHTQTTQVNLSITLAASHYTYLSLALLCLEDLCLLSCLESDL